MECAASPEHRVFFALQPDAEAAERIVSLAGDLRRRHGLKGRPTPASRLHLSLNFIGTFRGPPTRSVMEKAASLAAKVSEAAFRVTLNHVESWKNDPHPLVLVGDEGVIGAQILHAAIHKALVAGTMAPRREPQFWPHVTLLRDKAQVPGAFAEPVSWMAREFVLLDSPFGEGRHEVLGRWPLAG
ncbi:2'-5' RNA ligase family protein [Phenylobacterium sp.]|uniref:2'-5' RNA ligase family protein n=1 Tax=Phenylobacterium sp. TaxID=1871053 RepID=UPI0035657D10